MLKRLVPPIVPSISHRSHNGMRARVRTGDGELAECFVVKQGLRQGCVIEPLLFNTFTARLHVALAKLAGIAISCETWRDSGDVKKGQR